MFQPSTESNYSILLMPYNAGRRFFTKNTGATRTHNVHSFAVGAADRERMLDLRDYLRSRQGRKGRHAAAKLDSS